MGADHNQRISDVAPDIAKKDRLRTARDVLEHHVLLRETGDLEQDLARNYDRDVLVLTARRTFRGHEGVRDAAHLLSEAISPGSYRFQALIVGDRMGLAEWSAEGEDTIIRDGVDSYLVESGKIRAQTIHYTALSNLSAAAVGASNGRRRGVRSP